MIRDIYRYKFKNPVVTMGTFDGVHKGHQHLLEVVKNKAHSINGNSIAITYYHHPLETLNKVTFPYLLTEKSRKEALLKSYGIDHVFFLNFTKEMAKMTAYEFLKEVLIKHINPRVIVAGYDTHFGRNREGNYDFLTKYENEFDYVSEFVNQYCYENEIVSSSRIRDFIRKGRIEHAQELLGRNYTLDGVVVHGMQIGRKLGFPTINIQPEDNMKLVPHTGIYFTKVRFSGNEYFALANIGYSPTVKHTEIVELEAFLLDFSGDLYDRNIEISFLRRMRDEIKFANEKELINQIELDVVQARNLIKEYQSS